MGCGCGKSFSNSYATGQRRVTTSHVPNTRPVTQVTNIQSKSLQARQASAPQQASSGRRKV